MIVCLQLTRPGQGLVLGSMATILSSLRLHGGGPAFGVLPQLDMTFATELRHGAALFCSHVEKLIGTCHLEKRKPPDPSSDEVATPAPTVRHGPCVRLCSVCLASVSAYSHWLLELRRGDARGAASAWVPRTTWSAEALVQMRASSDVLDALAARLADRICNAYVDLSLACSREECTLGSEWSAGRAWRQDARCSHGVQAVAFTLRGLQVVRACMRALLDLHVHPLHSLLTSKLLQDLLSLGNQAAASCLFADALASVSTSLLELYAPLEPSAARAPQMHRDLRFLISCLDVHNSVTHFPPETAETSHVFSSAYRSESEQDITERSSTEDRAEAFSTAKARARAAVLGMLSLLSLHVAPAHLLLSLLREMNCCSARSSPMCISTESSWARETLLGAVQSANASSVMLAALQIETLKPTMPTGRNAFDPLHEHLQMQSAAQEPWPDKLAWEDLMTLKNFPLSGLPQLVIDVARRRPDISNALMHGAQTLDGNDITEIVKLLTG